MTTSGVPPRPKRGRVRSTPKGRRVDPAARDEVRALLGDAPRRTDLLIEYLHKRSRIAMAACKRVISWRWRAS
jgi:hypothetical protein